MITTFGIINFFKGATAEGYENTIKIVHPDGGKALPPGQTFHAAGPTEGGYIVVALWSRKPHGTHSAKKPFYRASPRSKTGCQSRPN